MLLPYEAAKADWGALLNGAMYHSIEHDSARGTARAFAHSLKDKDEPSFSGEELAPLQPGGWLEFLTKVRLGGAVQAS